MDAWNKIPAFVKNWAYVFIVLAGIITFVHNYAHADSDAVLEQHLKDFNGLLAQIARREQQSNIQEATANINFIDEKLAVEGVTERQEKVFLRNREYYVDLRECYRDEKEVCE